MNSSTSGCKKPNERRIVTDGGEIDQPSGGVAWNSQSGRDDSRLESDDEKFCKWCGTELPDWLINGPIAGGSSGTDPVELCGSCVADDMKFGGPRGELDWRKHNA